MVLTKTKYLAVLVTVLAGVIPGLAWSADQTQSLNRLINPPPVAAVAKKLQEERAKLPAGHVPLFTNDDLPGGKNGGVGVISPQVAVQSKPSPEMIQQAAYLSHQLAVVRSRLEMHKREVAVLEQQLAQNQMQYYPNPNQTLMQEYTRQDINQKRTELDDKKQQIAEDQQTVDQIQEKLSQLEDQLTWKGVSASALSGKQSVIPPGVKPGTHAYWRARFEAARQALAAAREQEKLAQEELKLLKLQQLRTLNPNLQSQLSAQIGAKIQEVQSAGQAVEQAQNNLQELQKKFEASGAPANWAE
ncbi:MAG: hypothetical protein ACRD1J_11920 [Terriglobia bacterium]